MDGLRKFKYRCKTGKKSSYILIHTTYNFIYLFIYLFNQTGYTNMEEILFYYVQVCYKYIFLTQYRCFLILAGPALSQLDQVDPELELSTLGCSNTHNRLYVLRRIIEPAPPKACIKCVLPLAMFVPYFIRRHLYLPHTNLCLFQL